MLADGKKGLNDPFQGDREEIMWGMSISLPVQQYLLYVLYL